MPRCRFHLFVPDNEEVPGTAAEVEAKRDTLREAFEESFTRTEAPPVTDGDLEWISDIFEDTEDQLARIDQFEQRCEEIYPEADMLRTRQQRAVMDDAQVDYEDVLMLQITHKLV